MINKINIYQEEFGNAEWSGGNAGGSWVQLWVAGGIKLGTLYVRGCVPDNDRSPLESPRP
mgnify:CR=1 FL=1